MYEGELTRTKSELCDVGYMGLFHHCRGKMRMLRVCTTSRSERTKPIYQAARLPVTLWRDSHEVTDEDELGTLSMVPTRLAAA